MNIERELRRCLPMHGMAYIGGDSESSTSNRTENSDQRVVGGDGSANSSLRLSEIDARGDVTLQITDAGQTARAIDAVSLVADSAMSMSSDMTRGALSTLDTATQGFQRGITDLFDQSVNEISDAYETSKAGEQKVLVAAGLLVVGMVALFIVKK